ncbi:MAG: peptidoglycan-binding protein [Pseudomonadota bacterium]|nr:peptidoglycan-binding protein [Pseudomonadota bacterium]
MSLPRLSILLAALATAGAGPVSGPAGRYDVVAVRASSEVAGTPEAMRDPTLRALVGQRMTFESRMAWYDGRVCASGRTRPSTEAWPHLAEPNLSDLQVAPGPTDHRVNQTMVIDCGGSAYDEITPFLMVDRRVLVMRSRNGVAYVVLERPLNRGQARAVERGLVRAGFDPGPVDGRIDNQTRRAIALFGRSQGAEYAFDQGVLTENVVAALR